VLGQAEGQREHRLEDVRHLGRGPHDELLARGVDDRGAGLHEHRHEALLAEAATDHDLVVVRLRLADGLGRVAAGARLARVEHPLGVRVRAQLRVHEGGAVLQRLLHVQDRLELVVVDLDQLGGVLGDRRAARDDHGDTLTGEVHTAAGQRGTLGRTHVLRDRPRAGELHLVGADVGGRVDADDARQLLGRRGVDALDRRVRERAADHRDVQQAGEGLVVGPLGPPGDEPAVLLAAAVAPDLLDRGVRRVLGGGHQAPPPATVCLAPASAVGAAPGFIFEAASWTARTMFW
jgi:hypothetical protein